MDIDLDNESLSLDNMISDEESIDGFLNLDNVEGLEEGTSKPEKETEKVQKNKDSDKTAEDDSEKNPLEEVGSENGEEEPKFNKETSQKNFYSSIATALKDEGILPDLSDDIVKTIDNDAKLAEVIQNHIKSQLDETQQRIAKALDNGVETTTIKNYENALKYLNDITDEMLENEEDQGVNLRKQIIVNDWLNKGLKQEKAIKLAEQSIENGTDIDDAKEALQGNKEFYKSGYDKIIEDAEKENKKIEEKRKEEAENLKKSILEDDKVFGDFEVDKPTRNKIFDTISKPVFKDKNTGQIMTELQHYQMENPANFIKYVGLAYTLTDGFKNLGGLLQKKIAKEKKRGFKELEGILDTTSRSEDGNLHFIGGNNDGNSYGGLGFDFDI